MNLDTGPTGDIGISSNYEPDINRRQPTNTNYLLSTGFRFVLQRIPAVTYFCQSCNLPSFAFSEILQPTRFINVKHPGRNYDFGDLDIGFIVDEDMVNYLEIHNWMKEIGNVEDDSEYLERTNKHFSDASITILNSAMLPNLTVNFKNVFPKALSGIDFNSTASDSEPLIVTATFTYTSFEVIKL
tara:strand:- start:175 stop:729 length:555 start_codon:yes stop_codon:yes gene_type:complete